MKKLGLMAAGLLATAILSAKPASAQLVRRVACTATYQNYSQNCAFVVGFQKAGGCTGDLPAACKAPPPPPQKPPVTTGTPPKTTTTPVVTTAKKK